jgi:phage baseplate assembly protein V
MNHLLDMLKRKIYLLIGRAILSAVDNGTKTATVQVTGLNGETITGIEVLSPYGFEAYPGQGQAVVLFVNGNRDQGMVLSIHDRENRPTDLEEGESSQYSKFNNYVKCNKNEEVEVNGKDDYAVAFNDLKTEFNKLKDDYNSHTHIITKVMPGVASITSEVTAAQNSSVIDNCKVDKVRLP